MHFDAEFIQKTHRFFVFFIDVFKNTDQETTAVFIRSSVRVRERGPWDGHVTPT